MLIVYTRQRAQCGASAVNNLHDGERPIIVVMVVMMTASYEQKNVSRDNIVLLTDKGGFIYSMQQKGICQRQLFLKACLTPCN